MTFGIPRTLAAHKSVHSPRLIHKLCAASTVVGEGETIVGMRELDDLLDRQDDVATSEQSSAC